MSTKISFYSVRKRGITPELSLIKYHLDQSIGDAVFHYFTLNEVKNDAATVVARRARTEYSKSVDTVISMDASVPRSFPDTVGNRIQLLDLYEYLFQSYLEKESCKTKKKQAFMGMSHIVTGSPFGSRTLKACYELQNDVTIIEQPLPIAQYMARGETRQEDRQWIEDQFPQAKGKKIIGMFFTSIDDEIRDSLEHCDITGFLNNLGDDWFVITDSLYFAGITNEKAAEASKKIGIIVYKRNSYRVLNTCDLLITDYSLYATIIAGRKIPVICLNIDDNDFYKYMKKEFPELCINKVSELCDLKPERVPYSQEQERFYREFYYESEQDTLEMISDLVK